MRVNVGSFEFAEADGTVWMTDTFNGGASAYSVADTVEIAGTENDAMYRSEIYNAFKLTVPVATPGLYKIVMHFAELYFDTVGARIFDIKLEGETVLSNLDLVEETGGKFVAIQYTFFPFITDGAVDIEGVNIANFAKLNGVEIILLPILTEAPTVGPTDVVPVPAPVPVPVPVPVPATSNTGGLPKVCVTRTILPVLYGTLQLLLPNLFLSLC